MNKSKKVYVLVEGHGEVASVQNLLTRISSEQDVHFAWAKPIRWKNLHKQSGCQRGADFIRAKPDAEAMLVLRDGDRGCPKQLGPEMADWMRKASLPFPSAVVLLHPEYEVLFLPCLDLIAGRLLDGRPGLSPGTVWDRPTWESKRGVKEWLTRNYPKNRCYRETLDQLPMTRMVDLERLRKANVPCFGTLERAVQFLARSSDAGAVYPAMPEP